MAGGNAGEWTGEGARVKPGMGFSRKKAQKAQKGRTGMAGGEGVEIQTFAPFALFCG